jgi:hypothetical protein
LTLNPKPSTGVYEEQDNEHESESFEFPAAPENLPERLLFLEDEFVTTPDQSLWYPLVLGVYGLRLGVWGKASWCHGYAPNTKSLFHVYAPKSLSLFHV